jgi:hypothetical protein
VEFQRASASFVKSFKQRDLLNVWLRLFARTQTIPPIAEYQPARFEDERPDLVYYGVNSTHAPPRLTIESDGTRTSSAHGHNGRGKVLDDDTPHMIASLKTISEDGSLAIRNLMRGMATLPTPKLRAVIDRELFHRAPSRIDVADSLEFS